MYITKWIEGEQNLHDFCMKRFKSIPRFSGTFGQVGPAHVSLVYKWREDKRKYTEMYLLFMEHPKGTVRYVSDIEHQNYEEIRANKGSLLVR